MEHITKNRLTLEIVQHKLSKLPKDQIKTLIFKNIQEILQNENNNHENINIKLTKLNCNDEELLANVESLVLCWEEDDTNHSFASFAFSGNNDVKVPIQLLEENIKIYIFKLYDIGSVTETVQDGNEGDQTTASNNWMLPNREFHGLWENLFYENDLKENLLKFVETTMWYSKKNIDTNIISCNRLALLHGPPGTGKTSLCKAIAQKMSIRLADMYKRTRFIEINSHSLFSKWFSESGKLVMKLFDEIKAVLENKQILVCLLIDEVESITFARDSISTNEPSDSLRVVNAVLTQLDQIRHHTNLLILTTSNITGTIDLAFLDRADIKQFIGNPTTQAIYEIYLTAIRELCRAEIIIENDDNQNQLLPYAKAILIRKLTASAAASNNSNNDDDENNVEKKYLQNLELLKVAELSYGLSGRILRKIPFLAHALHLQSSTVTLEQYLIAMKLAVKKHIHDNLQIHQFNRNVENQENSNKTELMMEIQK